MSFFLSRSKPTPILDPSNIYALIIGNNVYPAKNYRQLKGAVHDAESFKKFLTDKLKVSENNILLLRDARRQEIIAALKQVKEGKFGQGAYCDDMPDGSAFVLFYAGHGGRTDVPQSWKHYYTIDDQVQQLVPSDIGEVDALGNQVQGIPDRTIAAALRGLANRIGDNITLIFDCCFSTGQTPTCHIEEPSHPRCLLDLPALSDDCDENIISDVTEEGAIIHGKYGIMHQGNTPECTHILLAACQQDQIATENEEGGLFTSKLLSLLNSKTTDLTSFTYARIMLEMVMPDQCQIPVCFGNNQNRILFSRTEGKPTNDCFIGQIYQHNSTSSKFLLVHGGQAHGIGRESKFRIFSISPEQNLVGEGVTAEVFATCSNISVTPSLSKTQHSTFYCRLVQDYRRFSVFSSSSEKNILNKVNIDGITFGQVSTQEEAMVIIADIELYPSRLRIGFGPKSAIRCPTCRFSIPIKRNDFSRIQKALQSMFHIYNVFAIPKSIPQGWEGIDICFLKVEYNGAETGPQSRPTWIYRTGSFSHSMKDKGNVVTIPVRKRSQYTKEKDKDSYGLLIKNNSDRYLYAYVLCLDPGELIIGAYDVLKFPFDYSFPPPVRAEPWYSSTYFIPDVPHSQNDQEQLKPIGGIEPREEYPIGFLNSGADPYKFVLDDELEEDYTYFKIILTTAPADFSIFNQTYDPMDLPFLLPSTISTARSAMNLAQANKELEAVENQQWKRIQEENYYSINLTVHQHSKN